MATYCLIFQKKNTLKNNSKIRRAKYARLVVLSNCTTSDKKNSRFIKNKVANGYWAI